MQSAPTSFRKWYVTEIYKNNGYDIALVQRLLQHSSSAITHRYIGIEPQRIEKAIEGHVKLIKKERDLRPAQITFISPKAVF